MATLWLWMRSSLPTTNSTKLGPKRSINMDIVEYADKVWRQESDAMAYHKGDLREHGLSGDREARRQLKDGQMSDLRVDGGERL